MSKAFQLTIPRPCHESWNKMTPVEKGKFCSSCQKQVIDFTGMSERELVAFFKKPTTGSVCGRFNNDQLDRQLEIPRKRIPWLKYFFTIALPAFFAASKATAQGEVMKCMKADTTLVPRNLILGNAIPLRLDLKEENYKIISGKVVDEEGNPMVGTSLIRKGTRSGAVSDQNGDFKIQVPKIDSSATLVISYVGYKAKEVEIKSIKENILIELTEEDRMMSGEVIVTVGLIRRKPINRLTIPTLARIFKDTAFKNFKFYPNPATPNSNITIEWKKPEAGDFEIQLLNQQGQVVDRKTENFIEKINSVQFVLPSITSGNYFLVLVNRKTGKRMTEKLIIQ